MAESLHLLPPDGPRLERVPDAAPDLDAEFDALTDSLRREVRRLRDQAERFGRSYQKQLDARSFESDEVMQRAYRRLKQCQQVVTNVESNAAYLLGFGVGPADTDAEDRLDDAQRVLESLEAERERIYRDVHDGPAQALANAIFEVEFLERVADRAADRQTDPRTLRVEMRRLKEQLREALESVRGMIYDLRPPTLSELGLAVALESYANEYGSRHGILVACDLDRSDTGLLPQQELAVFRVLQEALQNVHRHAQATGVRVEWTREPARWVLRCIDDGIGFDLVKAARRKRSVGLLSMRERSALIGGTLDVRSGPGEGTIVTLNLPMRSGVPADVA